MYNDIYNNLLKVLPENDLDFSIRFSKSVPKDISDSLYFIKGVVLGARASFISFYNGEIITILDHDYSGELIIESNKNRIIILLPGNIEFAACSIEYRLAVFAKLTAIFCAYESRMNPLIRVVDTFNTIGSKCLNGFADSLELNRIAPIIILSQVYQQIDNSTFVHISKYKDAFNFDSYLNTVSDELLISTKSLSIYELLDEGKIIPLLIDDKEKKNDKCGDISKG